MSNNQQLLLPLAQQVETHLNLAIRVFQNLDTSKLIAHAADGGWSIAQCLWHLNSYGEYYLPHIEHALQKPASKPFSSGWFGAYFIKMMNPLTGTKKYKAFQKHVPPDVLDAQGVVATFIEQQERLLVLLRKAEEANLNTRIPISISKWITLKLGDVFGFVIAHNERHVQQASRVFQELETFKPN